MKSFRAEQLFIVHSSSGLIVNGVALAGNVSEMMVKGHVDRVVKANVIRCSHARTKFYQLPNYRFDLDVPFDFEGSIISITANAFG